MAASVAGSVPTDYRRSRKENVPDLGIHAPIVALLSLIGVR